MTLVASHAPLTALVFVCVFHTSAFGSDAADRTDAQRTRGIEQHRKTADRAERPAAAPASREREQAAESAARIEREVPLRGADRVSDLVRKLGRHLADAGPPVPFRWRFTVFRDRSINAFAIGDGRIYVSDGSLARCGNEAELAALIAHEMGHQLAGHFNSDPDRPVEILPELLDLLRLGTGDEVRVGSIKQSIDPAKEQDADRRSIDILREAGYDPGAALRLARRVLAERSGRIRHLDDERRVDALAAMLEGVRRGGRTDSPEFVALRRELAAEFGSPADPAPGFQPPGESALP